MQKQFYVYILASKRNGTLYVGVTSELMQRMYQHRTGAVEGFTKTYGVHLLVYFEVFEDSSSAIAREKLIKHWPRKKKLQVIEAQNPLWRDLYGSLA
ncbi:MAG: GIY-YIG nuclease family protein [Rhodospirillaceae bacterium]